jgi:hypothetical protein
MILNNKNLSLLLPNYLVNFFCLFPLFQQALNKLKSKNILACSQKLQTSTVKNNSSLLNKD